MPIDIFPTTAENVIAATDAVLTSEQGCDVNYVADFMEVPVSNAQNALEMARELGLVNLDRGKYSPKKPFAVYLATARDSQKAAVLRIVLENYPPYQAFKFRLAVTTLASQAADQVKVMHGLNRHRDEIKDTLISLGTFAQSLVSEGAGLFRPTDLDIQQAGFLEVIAEVAADRARSETEVRMRLGNTACDWIDYQEVFSPLVTAYQKLVAGNEPSTSIGCAGNAVESFIVQLGVHHSVNLAGASGINSKVDKFHPNQLNTKHKNMLKYLGHIRNAADHGVDIDIGSSWTLTQDTAAEYVHVAMSAIKSIVEQIKNNRYVI